MTPSAENLLLGSGALYFDRFVNGASTGERHLGNCSAFTLATTVEKIEKYNSMVAAKSLYKSVVKQIKATGKITLDEFEPSNLALGLLGEEGVITQTQQTAVAVSDVKAFQGRYAKIGDYRDITDVIVKDAALGTTTYVLNTDYTIDAQTGRIFTIASGAITDGELLDITISCPAKTYPKIVGAQVANVEGFLRFVGDPAAGPTYEGEFWKVLMSPDGEMGFIGDDFGSFGLTFDCQDDGTKHPTERLYRLINL